MHPELASDVTCYATQQQICGPAWDWNKLLSRKDEQRMAQSGLPATRGSQQVNTCFPLINQVP